MVIRKLLRPVYLNGQIIPGEQLSCGGVGVRGGRGIDHELALYEKLRQRPLGRVYGTYGGAANVPFRYGVQLEYTVAAPALLIQQYGGFAY